MKNAIAYGVDGSQRYIEFMVNSINSFHENNPDWLVDSIDTIVLSNVPNLELPGLHPRCRPKVVPVEFDYASRLRERNKNYLNRFTDAAMFRCELFRRQDFHDYDNILYLDCDTVVNKDVSELFVERGEPVVFMVPICAASEPMRRGCCVPCHSGLILFNPVRFDEMRLRMAFKDMMAAASKSRSCVD